MTGPRPQATSSPTPPSSTPDCQLPQQEFRPLSPSSPTDGLDEFLEEAIWYEEYQRALSDALPELIQETERDIVTACRDLAVAERVQRDAVKMLKARQDGGQNEVELQGMKMQLDKTKREVKELEQLVSSLEKTLRQEVAMLNAIRG